MIKHHRFCLLFLLLLLVAFPSSFMAQTINPPDGPRVVKAVAPAAYPQIALQAHAIGKVVVEVEVGADGQVMSARAVEGHPLLQAAAAKAARRWQFAMNDKSSPVKVRLTFDFQVGAKKDDQEISFNAPYQFTYCIDPGPPINSSNN